MGSATNIGVVSTVTTRAWSSSKTTLLAGVLGGVLLLDIATKMFIQRTFHLYQQVDVIGDYVRLTYIHNPGAAFGIELGSYSRFIFLFLSLMALAALGGMYWVTPAKDRIRLASIALICGGAMGNLLDRIRSSAGVVDFLDVGFGNLRWPVFNVADIAVTTGAVFLALSLWREEQQAERDR
jgi:signal peptidase II